MTSQPSHESLNETIVLAERVRQQLEVFPGKFRELGEGGELAKVLRTPRNLSGPKVEQKPEDFTEQYLIEPVLHGLGYLNPVSEDFVGEGPHFVRQPSTFDKIENLQPDYLLKNLSPEVVCILEAKAANREQPGPKKEHATDDIKEYVASNTFSKYLKSRKQRYLIAIGTDGLRWVLRAKDVRSGETIEPIDEKVDLSGIVEVLAQQEAVIEGEPAQKTGEIRQELAEEFVPYFSARTMADFVRDSFE